MEFSIISIHWRKLPKTPPFQTFGPLTQMQVQANHKPQINLQIQTKDRGGETFKQSGALKYTEHQLNDVYHVKNSRMEVPRCISATGSWHWQSQASANSHKLRGSRARMLPLLSRQELCRCNEEWQVRSLRLLMYMDEIHLPLYLYIYIYVRVYANVYSIHLFVYIYI